MKRVFLRNGAAAELIQELEDGRYLVEKMLCLGTETEEGCCEGRTELLIVNEVYDGQPQGVYSEAIKKQLKEIDRLGKKKVALESSIDDKKREADDIERECNIVLNRYKNHESLKYALDLLDGKITHLVDCPRYEIVAVRRKDYDTDLLTFSIDGDDRISIKDSWVDLIPACSYEDAKKKLQSLILSLDALDHRFIDKWKNGELKEFRFPDSIRAKIQEYLLSCKKQSSISLKEYSERTDVECEDIDAKIRSLEQIKPKLRENNDCQDM